MADPSKFLHSWNLSRSNWLIRLYVFMLDEDALETVNFCKLFWATLFAPFILLLMGAAWIGSKIRKYLFVNTYDWYHDHKYYKQSEAKVKKKREWPKKLVAAIASFFEHLAAFIQKYTKLLIGLIVGVLLTGLSFLIDYVIYHTAGFLNVLIVTGIVVGLFAAGCVLIFTLAWLEGEYFVFSRAGRVIGRFLGPKIVKFLLAVGHGFKAVFHFLAAGFYAFKYRTCPRVIITE